MTFGQWQFEQRKREMFLDGVDETEDMGEDLDLDDEDEDEDEDDGDFDDQDEDE